MTRSLDTVRGRKEVNGARAREQSIRWERVIRAPGAPLAFLAAVTSRIVIAASAVAAIPISTLSVVVLASGWVASRHHLHAVGFLVAAAFPFLAAVIAAIVSTIVSSRGMGSVPLDGVLSISPTAGYFH